MKPAPTDEDLFGENEAEERPAANVGTDDAPAAAESKPADSTDGSADEKPEKDPEPAADPDDPFASIVPTPDEPVRRWIDDTGSFQTYGRLVEVRGDRVRLLKGNGAFSTVPMHRLSEHDRLYVIAASARFAAASAPTATDTAGL